MIRYQWIIIGLFAGLIYSCDTAWDKHFDNNSEVEGAEVSNLNLLDYLKTHYVSETSSSEAFSESSSETSSETESETSSETETAASN